MAFVGAEVDPVGTARGLARDIALFDQRGCLSVQAVYTEGDPEELAAALAWALALESARLPHGPIAPATAAAVQQLRAEAELRRGQPSTDLDLELAVGTVLVESETLLPSGARPANRQGARRREAAAMSSPRSRPGKGNCRVRCSPDPPPPRSPPIFPLLGFSRLAPAGELQSADASWANGGIDPLAVFSTRS